MKPAFHLSQNCPALIGGAFFCAVLLLCVTLMQVGCAADRGQRVGVPMAADVVWDSTRVMIQPDELQAMLHDPRLVVLHVGHGDRGYGLGHLPGARYVDFTDIMALERDGRKTELLTADDFEALLGRLGLKADSRVVMYGDAAGVFPARLYFTMCHYGWGDRGRLLNGHLRGWIAQGRPTETGEADTALATNLSLRSQVTPGVIATDAEVRRAVADGGVTLLDVRPADQFSGEKSGPGVKVPGRIPGAINLPWRDMVTGVKPPWLQPETTLRAALDAAGVDHTQPVIVYDAAGMHSSLAFAVLRELGYDVSLYDGGYAAWADGASDAP